jgi:hypothetical protein
MSAFEGVKKYFDDYYKLACDLGYSKTNLAILRGDFDWVMQNDPEQYACIQSCNYLRDKRTPFEYARDIAASWLFEDYFLNELSKTESFETFLDGADKQRKFLTGKKTSAKSDYKIRRGGVEKKLELMTDYKGYWRKNKVIDLRDDKFNKLCAENSLFVGVSISTNEFFVTDFKNLNTKHIDSHFLYGGKPVTQISTSEIEFLPFSMPAVIGKLLGYCL